VVVLDREGALVDNVDDTLLLMVRERVWVLPLLLYDCFCGLVSVEADNDEDDWPALRLPVLALLMR
jgi:hypothetical protein